MNNINNQSQDSIALIGLVIVFVPVTCQIITINNRETSEVRGATKELLAQRIASNFGTTQEWCNGKSYNTDKGWGGPQISRPERPAWFLSQNQNFADTHKRGNHLPFATTEEKSWPGSPKICPVTSTGSQHTGKTWHSNRFRLFNLKTSATGKPKAGNCTLPPSDSWAVDKRTSTREAKKSWLGNIFTLITLLEGGCEGQIPLPVWHCWAVLSCVSRH